MSTYVIGGRGHDAHRAVRAGGLGGVLQQVGQDALHQVRAGVGERPARVEPQLKVGVGVDAPLQRDPLGHERVDVNGFEHHRGIAGKLREGAHAPLERVDLAHDDLRRLIDEGAVGRLPGLHLFHRQSNRRERVLQLVRGLARQRLPAGHLGQVHEPLPLLPQLVGHVVERVERLADFIARAFPCARHRQAPRPVAGGEVALSAAVSC